jgi:hypothetical protein
MRPMRMRRLVVLLAVPALLCGCGGGPADDAVARDHPTGARDVVLRISDGGGMTTRQIAFATPPVEEVTGDGTVYLRMEEATRQGIVWPLVTRQVSEQSLQELLREADDAGLLAAPPDYEPSDTVMDGGTTAVTLDAGGGTWTHEAYALGYGGDESGARRRLQDFRGYAARWAREHEGPAPREVTPTVLRVMATPVTGGLAVEGRLPTWPEQSRVRLADVGTCRVVRDPAAVRALTTQPDSYYLEAGRIFEVAAAVPLPGDSCGGGAGS